MAEIHSLFGKFSVNWYDAIKFSTIRTRKAWKSTIISIHRKCSISQKREEKERKRVKVSDTTEIWADHTNSQKIFQKVNFCHFLVKLLNFCSSTQKNKKCAKMWNFCHFLVNPSSTSWCVKLTPRDVPIEIEMWDKVQMANI